MHKVYYKCLAPYYIHTYSYYYTTQGNYHCNAWDTSFTANIDQSIYYNEWIYVGRNIFRNMYMTNLTTETDGSRKVGYDEVKLIS